MTQRSAVSSWQESLDGRRGRLPLITKADETITFELGILGDDHFKPTPRTRLVIRCHRSGEITLRIREGRSSGV